jgi:hypothetical protein
MQQKLQNKLFCNFFLNYFLAQSNQLKINLLQKRRHTYIF